MHRCPQVILMLIAVVSPVWARHGPIDLSEKIKRSGLIVTGVVTETRELDNETPGSRTIDTAHMAATVQVEEVLYGKVEGKSIDVGFLYDYACAPMSFEVGQRFLFFLQKSERGYWAPVNWQYGALEVVDGQVDDVAAHWPEKKIPLEDAIATIRERLPKNPACPDCGDAGKVVPIVYGRPGKDLLGAARRGEVVLGGCIESEENPRWHCNACGKEW